MYVLMPNVEYAMKKNVCLYILESGAALMTLQGALKPLYFF